MTLIKLDTYYVIFITECIIQSYYEHQLLPEQMLGNEVDIRDSKVHPQSGALLSSSSTSNDVTKIIHA